MRRVVVALLFGLVVAVGVDGSALASEPSDVADVEAVGGHGSPVAQTSPPRRPSGFWTGTRPAKGGAYRWRLLAIGIGVICVSTFLTVRFIRKQSRADVPAE
jgi:hypothetical protein